MCVCAYVCVGVYVCMVCVCVGACVCVHACMQRACMLVCKFTKFIRVTGFWTISCPNVCGPKHCVNCVDSEVCMWLVQSIPVLSWLLFVRRVLFLLVVTVSLFLLEH